jgi:hypothetical protein
MTDDLLSKNLAALAKENYALAAAIETLSPDGNLTVTKAADGLPTLSVTGETGGNVWLHSRYKPAVEAKRLIERFPRNPLSTFLLLGFGLGYHARELFRTLPKESYLIILERDLAVVRAAFSNIDFSDMLADNRVMWWLGIRPDDVYPYLRGLVDMFFTAQAVIVPHPASMSAFPDFYGCVKKGIADFVRAGTTMMRTGMILARRNMENRIYNIHDYVAGPGVEQFRDRFKGVPAIIVSAGPSLQESIETLRKAKGRAVVISVSTAYKALLNHGIAPDFTAIIDYNKISRRYFEAVPVEDACPLICDPKASWEAIESHPGPKLFYQDQIMSILLGGQVTKGELEMGATVAHLVFFFAQYTGADPIIFVGQDLAYPYNVSHVPGTMIYDHWRSQVNRFNTYQMKEWEFILRLRSTATKVTDVLGHDIYTDELMFSYLRDFDMLCSCSGRKCVNTSSAGARIGGTDQMPLGEALAKYCSNALAPGLTDYPQPDAADVAARRRMACDELKKRLKECDGLGSHYEDALKLLRKAAKRIEQKKDADPIVAKVLRIKEQIKKFEGVYALLANVAHSDDMIRRKRDSEIRSEDLAPRERQKEQAERDIAFIAALKECLVFVRDLLRKGVARLDRSEVTKGQGTCGCS